MTMNVKITSNKGSIKPSCPYNFDDCQDDCQLLITGEGKESVCSFFLIAVSMENIVEKLSAMVTLLENIRKEAL